MEASWAIDIFSTLNKQDIISIRQFYASPYFNSGKNAEKLALILEFHIEQVCSRQQNTLAKEALFNRVFPGEPFHLQRLDKLLVEFYKLCRKFLILEALEDPAHVPDQELLLAEAYQKRELENKYFHQLKKTEKLLDETSPISRENYYHQFVLKSRVDKLVLKKNASEVAPSYQQTTEWLDRHFLVNRLLYMQDYEFLKKLIARPDIDQLNHDFFPEHVFLKYANDDLYINIMYKLYQLTINNSYNASDFYKIIELLRQHRQEIVSNELVDLYITVRNICANLIDQGHGELRDIYYELQKEEVRNNFLKKFTPSFYISIVINGCRLKDFEWLEIFINSSTTKVIEDNEIRDYQQLGLAYLLFAQGNFEESLQYTNGTYPEIELFNIARVLELKAYYELNSDLLEYKIDAYKMYLSRNIKKKNSDRLQELYSNFVNILYQLYTSRPGDKDRAVKIIQRIHAKKVISDRAWLLEKARQLGRLTDAEFESIPAE